MTTYRLVCAGCGSEVPGPEVERYPFRCGVADHTPEIDHVLEKVLVGRPHGWPSGSEDNSFLRYRTLLYSYQVSSLGAGPWSSRVQHLDDGVAAIAGARFRMTPFGRREALSSALGFSARGGVWVKDETGNVSGSHKARHLAGIMLYLQALEDIGLARERPELAIASCGNAALAAAIVARAAGWRLRTFIPSNANPAVVHHLRELGATLVVCPRQPGESGDPAYLRFKEAIRDGALPFCCQGPDNGLTIEGGETLAYEIADQIGGDTLDAFVVQVGGGALASACVQGFGRTVAAGRLARMPRVFAVQTAGAAPLARAYARAAERAARSGVEEALRYAASHRSEFMWPWETEPRSVAHGILDDETYDWLAVVRGMLETGGGTVTVDEETLEAANRLARETTGIDVDHTGSAGLAGLMTLCAQGRIAPDEKVAVIFSGVRREMI
jgi:threonine synthase